MTTSKNTLWIAGTGVLAVLILVASYFLLIAPKRAQAADTVASAVGVEVSNQTLAAETERLKAQFATIDEQRQQLQEIKSELPAGSEIPALIRQFSVYATGAGVTVTDIAPGTLSDYVASNTAVATTGDATSDTTSGSAAVVSSGISSMPVSVTVKGSFAGTELFVKNLQADMSRYLLVDSVALVREDSGLSTTITGSIFVLKDASTTAAAQATGATDTTAATAAGTATATTTGVN